MAAIGGRRLAVFHYNAAMQKGALETAPLGYGHLDC